MKESMNTLEELGKSISYKIDLIKEYGEPMNEASYGYEYGVIITGHQAEAVLKALEENERYKRALREYYRVNPLIIANMCDNIIDKSGALLGEVRKQALKGM